MQFHCASNAKDVILAFPFQFNFRYLLTREENAKRGPLMASIFRKLRRA